MANELICTINIRTGVVEKVKRITHGEEGVRPTKEYTIAFLNHLFIVKGAEAACEELYNAANDGSLSHKDANVLLEKYIPSTKKEK